MVVINMTNQDKELKYCSVNYDRLPVTITKGQGIYLFEVNNNQYFDFLSGYSGSRAQPFFGARS